MKKVIGHIRAAIDSYNMINNNDTIAIGVSGGKDSLVLLFSLVELMKYYTKPFNIVAITIDPCFNNKQMDCSKIEELCRRHNVKYIIKRTSLGNVVFEERKEKNPCSLCAKMRRGILHKIAKENGCNKIALGHHCDDAIETFFMNLFNGGRINCFSPVTYLPNRDLWLIRPMVFCYEKDISSFSTRYNLPVEKSCCPVNGVTERQNIKDLISILEKRYPELKKKTIGAIQRANIDKWELL